MNKREIAQLLTVASGFDRRVVDELTVEAWASIPELVTASYEPAVAAVVAHQTGPKRTEYLTVGHIVDALRLNGRSTAAAIEADVRSAKARGILPREWPARDRIPADVLDALTTARESERRAAEGRFAFDQLEGAPIDPGDIGRVPS